MALLPMGVALLAGSSAFPLTAQDSSPSARAPETTFSEILAEQTGKTFDLIKAYVEKHPEAPDAESAYEWLFHTAREEGWEAQALSTANQYLRRTDQDLPAKTLAAQVRIVGWAKTGEWDDALLDFERHLSNVRLRMPTETVELAKTLALEAQIAGQPETARDIYRNLSRTLFLNPDVKMLCETKLAKLELIGKPAPPVGVKDLDGQAVNLADYRGKWVLLDFWATNCPPCVKDMPHLKRLHETHHSRGLEIVGLSLDEDADTVRAFQKSRDLPWILALSSTDNGQTRESYHVSTIPAMYLINPQGQVELIDPTLRDLEHILPDRLKPNGNLSP